jgi:hypothetical protein
MTILQTTENFVAREDSEILVKNVRATTMDSSSSNNNMTPLAQDFQPGPMDVICAKGKRALNHSGNKRLRALIHSRLEEYSKAASKLDKSLIVSSIVESVCQASPDGGFVKERDGQWFEVGDHVTREKIGQIFRDILHFKYSSSTKAKKYRRKKLQCDISNEVEQFMRENLKFASKFEQIKAFCNVSTNDHETMDSLFAEANKELLKQIKRRTSHEVVDNQGYLVQSQSLPIEPSATIQMTPLATSTSSLGAPSSECHDRFDLEPVSRSMFLTGGESWEWSGMSAKTSNDEEDASGPVVEV